MNDATSFRSPITHNLVNAAKDYLAHTQMIAAQIEAAFQTRLGGIGSPTRGEYYEANDFGPDTPIKYIYIQDDQANTEPKQYLFPDTLHHYWANNIVWYVGCGPKGCADTEIAWRDDEAALWRRTYVDRVTSLLEKRYNYAAERKANIHRAIEELEKVINTYEPLTR